MKDNYGPDDPKDNNPDDNATFTRYGITDFRFKTLQGNGDCGADIPGTVVVGNNKIRRTFNLAPITTNGVCVQVDNAMAGYSRIVEVEAWGR